MMLLSALLLSMTKFGYAAQSAELSFDNRLLPQPASLKVLGGSFRLRSNISVRIEGASDARLKAAVDRAMTRLHTKADPVDSDRHAGLTVQVIAAGAAVPFADEDEIYRLHVTAGGMALEAPTTVGVLRGLQTLLQLAQPADGGFTVPAVEIEDAPRFRWRGLLVDCSRHFEPVAEIKRTLDAMEAVKLNVFHWHLTDDQGFRVESKVFPKLTQVGSDGLFYSQEQIREVVAYAADRGIRVVPEFEMPGHSTAWLLAYPELSSGPPPTEIRRAFGISPYAIDPTREQTYEFLKRFLAEMVTLFPDSYVHIGGDETTAPEWKTNPRILRFMREHGLKDSAALQAYFNQRVLTILTGMHRQMIGWDEIFNPALPKDIVIQTWRGESSIAASTAQGYEGILSAGYYLDGMKSAEEHYLVDPAPADAALTPVQRKLILGGEVAMWGEFVHENTLDSRIWPRTAAVAERFWSPESVRDVDDMYRRLDAVSLELDTLGLRHLAQQDMALRALTENKDTEDLKIFASVLEPASFGERYHQHHASQLDALDKFSDAVRPDPPARYEFERLVKAYLSVPQHDSSDRYLLEAKFRALLACAPAVLREVNMSPNLRLREIQMRAQQLPELAKLGLQATDALASGSAMSPEWHSRATALIAEAEKPSANVHFVFLIPLKSLVMAVKQ
jgi:hexosaminidase